MTRRLLERVIPELHIPLIIVAVAAAVALVLMVAPAQAGSPVAAEATATPSATPSPVQRILFSGCPPGQAPEPSYCHDWAIYEINSDGSGLRKLLGRGEDRIERLKLSPDGYRLFFCTSAGPGNWRAHILDLTTLRLSDLDEGIFSCEWATTETAICDVSAKEQADNGLYLLDFRTGNRHKVLTGLAPTAFVQAMSVSPDGQHLLLTERLLKGGYPQERQTVVVRVMIDGTQPTDLLTIPSPVLDDTVDVSWSPSGEWVAVQADLLPEPASFWTSPTRLWDFRNVAERPGIAHILGWSPNEGEVLAYACGGDRGVGQIIAVDREGTGIRTVATFRGPSGPRTNACGQGRLSPDQHSFLFWFPWWTAPAEQWGLYVATGVLDQVKPILLDYVIEDVVWSRP